MHKLRKIQIPKKSGGSRTIYVAPRRGKARKTWDGRARAVAAIVADLAPEGVLHGFTAGRSPLTNAATHAGHSHVLQMDLSDFFDHCTPELIERGLTPLAAKEWIAASARADAKALGDECCIDGAARQGLPSSPACANAAGIPMDREILTALPDGVTYTRYADDLTFSADDPALLRPLRATVARIAPRHGQAVNTAKTRMQCATAGRLVITGVAVAPDGSLHATKACRRRLRAARHNCAQLDAQADAMPPVQAAIFLGVHKRQFQELNGLESWARAVALGPTGHTTIYDHDRETACQDGAA